MSKPMTGRSILGLALHADIDKPVVIKLGIHDSRTLSVKAWSTKDGALLLVLDEDHDFFPVGRYIFGGRRDIEIRRTATEHEQRGGYPNKADKVIPLKAPA